MSQQRILDKIQKCMNLANSDNASEAAAALRQAQKLMAKHNLQATDLELHTVSEVMAKGVTRAKVAPTWVSFLRHTIADVFGVTYLCRTQRTRGVWYNWALFVGVGEKPSAAQYCYEVLFRQITSDRRKFKETLPLRLKPGAKAKRLALFCEAWVSSVRGKVESVAMPEKDEELVKRFTERTYGELEVGKHRKEVEPTTLSDLEALRAGGEAGESANLFRGVSAREADKQVEVASS